MAIDLTNPNQAEIIGLERQRRLADMLLRQGMEGQQNQGQMVSGRYVAPAFTQRLADLANIYVGQKTAEQADQQQLAMAEKLRKQGQEGVSNILDLAMGRKASTAEAAGPYDVSQGIQKPVIEYPELKPDSKAALAQALRGQTLEERALVPSLLANALPREITPIEAENLKLRKEEIGLQRANANKPQIVETTEGIFSVDPRNPSKMVPLTYNGQALTGKKGELPEFQGKATMYGIQMSTGLKDMNTLEKNGFNPATFANQAALAVAGNKAGNVAVSPEVRSYKQGMDNFANAYIRIQSGANVPEHEIMRNLKNMMPAVGDDEYTLNQKAEARNEALRGVRIASGQGNRYIPNPNVITPAAPNAPAASKGPLVFSSEADAARAGLPNNTKVIINGVSGTWTN